MAKSCTNFAKKMKIPANPIRVTPCHKRNKKNFPCHRDWVLKWCTNLTIPGTEPGIVILSEAKDPATERDQTRTAETPPPPRLETRNKSK